MKRIHTLLATALMVVATALWSGCSNNELTDTDFVTEQGSSQTAQSFKFSIKKTGAKTRATVTDLLKPEESTINTLYVALFLKDSGNEQNSKLYRIYCYDDNAGEDWNKLKMTKNEDVYTITKPGTVGDYVVYFIANPDKSIKDALLTMQKETESRAMLSAFESTLQTSANTADGKTDDSGTAQAETSKQRGFIMMGKENITLSEYTNFTATLNRLAARFDFINSAATAENNEVTITKIEFNQGAKSSIVATSSTLTNTARLSTLTYADLSTSGGWTTQVGNYFTAYTYENLITENALNRVSITVYYTLKTGGETANKKLTIDLKKDDKYLGVTRNHLYRIYLNGVSGEFKLTVADWNEGNTVSIPNEELAIVYKPTDLGKIGDYAYYDASADKLVFSDGGLRKMNFSGLLEWADTKPTPIADKQCIGIVFSNATSEKDQQANFKHGYIIGLKNIATKIRWRNSSAAEKFTSFKTMQEAINNWDGYTNCQMIKNAGALSDYPAIEAAMKYNETVKVPATTSGWYLPTIGQLSLLAVNFTSANLNLSQDVTLNTSSATRQYFSVGDVTTGIGRIFGGLPADSYDAISTPYDIEDVSWLYTSCRGPRHSARGVFYTKTNRYAIQFDVEISEQYPLGNVRPVLAF